SAPVLSSRDHKFHGRFGERIDGVVPRDDGRGDQGRVEGPGDQAKDIWDRRADVRTADAEGAAPGVHGEQRERGIGQEYGCAGAYPVESGAVERAANAL